VFVDSNLDRAASEVVKGIYSNTGQYCDARSRLLVEDSIREPLVDKVGRHAREITLSPGMENPDMGPLVSAELFERVMGYVEAGRTEGADLIIWGHASGHRSGGPLARAAASRRPAAEPL
jgi:aldehyde dehydrogenase (NAD+)